MDLLLNSFYGLVSRVKPFEGERLKTVFRLLRSNLPRELVSIMLSFFKYVSIVIRAMHRLM